MFSCKRHRHVVYRRALLRWLHGVLFKNKEFRSCWTGRVSFLIFNVDIRGSLWLNEDDIYSERLKLNLVMLLWFFHIPFELSCSLIWILWVVMQYTVGKARRNCQKVVEMPLILQKSSNYPGYIHYCHAAFCQICTAIVWESPCLCCDNI
jgi:hypothetical protein